LEVPLVATFLLTPSTYHITERNTGSTDHVPFQQAGLPGFQFIQDPLNYDSRTHHTNLDTNEHLSEPDLKQAAVVEAIFLYNTAMRDEMLPRPKLPLYENDKPPEVCIPMLRSNANQLS
jgi:carboxypeptidase Q